MKLLLALTLLATATVTARAQVDLAAETTVIAVAKAMPAVVNINTERVMPRQARDSTDEFFNYFYGRQRQRRVVRQTVQSLGSGFIVQSSGYIVTNEHVVERATDLKISVTTNDGKTFEARYITGSTETDLAFIKIDGDEPFPFIDLDTLSPNLLGQTVLVLGNPLGYGSSVSRGILSARNRAVTVNNTDFKGLIQTDAAINPGNSGGPLVDLNGSLIGVSSVKMAFTPQGVPTQGLGFAIPGDVVRDRVREFTKTATASRKSAPVPATPAQSLAKKYFGITMQALTAELSESLGYEDDAGVVIADVDPGSPAEAAGMSRGLVIVGIGRYDAESVAQIESLLEPIGAGSLVDFSVSIPSRVRGRIIRQVRTVTLKAR